MPEGVPGVRQKVMRGRILYIRDGGGRKTREGTVIKSACAPN